MHDTSLCKGKRPRRGHGSGRSICPAISTGRSGNSTVKAAVFSTSRVPVLVAVIATFAPFSSHRASARRSCLSCPLFQIRGHCLHQRLRQDGDDTPPTSLAVQTSPNPTPATGRGRESHKRVALSNLFDSNVHQESNPEDAHVAPRSGTEQQTVCHE
jgi:hypothetical protein